MEIQSLRRTLARLREEEANSALIEEYETEYRNLTSLYKAATETYDADVTEPRLPDALASLGFGDWTLTNVYSFVYDASMELRSTMGANSRGASMRRTTPPRCWRCSTPRTDAPGSSCRGSTPLADRVRS